MTNSQPVLRLQNISRRFGGLWAVAEMDLDLDRGQIMGVIGPNGAGKSTLFNLITSFYKPTTGEIHLDGEDITAQAPNRICRLGVSRTFQLVKTYLTMTALENVMVGSHFGSRMGKAGAMERGVEALELVGLGDKLDLEAGHMTLSDRRLLEVARALASLPKVTLLDEPLAGLNPAETMRMMKVINRAREERNMSIMWVEHKVDAVFDLCDRIVVMNHGRKIADGAPGQVEKNQKVIEAYLGKSRN